jgi:hypothetical protein
MAMESVQGFDFFRLQFDADGNPQTPQVLAELEQRAAAAGATDAILIAHGFRNDENDATGLYTRFLETLRQNLGRPEFQASLGARKYVVAGIYWPSKAFKEAFGGDEGSVQGLDDELAQKQAVRAQLEDLKADATTPEQRAKIDQAVQLLDQVEGSTEAQDKLVDNVLSLLAGAEKDPTEGLEEIRSKEGSELLDALRAPIILPTADGGGDGESDGGAAGLGAVFVPGGDGETQGIGSFFGSIFGRIGQFLNLTTWYMMKNRSGVVGANGVAKTVRDLKAKRPDLKVHLVGHSLGGRLMASCAKSLADPKLQPDSLTLLEAAFSHYGFSPDAGGGTPGFFRAVVQEKVVRGPLVATFSKLDTVVGKVYAVASRLAGDNVKAIGDANDPFGGIGRNGTQKTQEALVDKLHIAGQAYDFASGKVINLDGSDNLITNHGDVTNANVTYAFASVMTKT